MSDLHNILILDTETTGVDENATAIEVACILYSVPHAAPIRSFASLIRASSNPAEPVNRIPSALLLDAPEADRVWTSVQRHAEWADAVVAHNADFDPAWRPTIAEFFARLDVSEPPPVGWHFAGSVM